MWWFRYSSSRSFSSRPCNNSPKPPSLDVKPSLYLSSARHAPTSESPGWCFNARRSSDAMSAPRRTPAACSRQDLPPQPSLPAACGRKIARQKSRFEIMAYAGLDFVVIDLEPPVSYQINPVAPAVCSWYGSASDILSDDPEDPRIMGP